MFPYELWYMGCWSFLKSVGPRFLFFLCDCEKNVQTPHSLAQVSEHFLHTVFSQIVVDLSIAKAGCHMLQ